MPRLPANYQLRERGVLEAGRGHRHLRLAYLRKEYGAAKLGEELARVRRACALGRATKAYCHKCMDFIDAKQQQLVEGELLGGPRYAAVPFLLVPYVGSAGGGVVVAAGGLIIDGEAVEVPCAPDEGGVPCATALLGAPLGDGE